MVIWRVPRGESIIRPGSHCPHCDAPVKPRDNIPIVSWVLLRGRCRSCKAPISGRYPLVEAGVGVMWAVIVLARGFDSDLVWELPFATMLAAVALIDLDHHIIPNKILLPAAVWGVISAAIVRLSDLPELLAWGAGAFAVLLLIALIYPAGMGMGDVKLAGVMGLYLGNAVLPAFLVAFLSGSVVGVTMIARHGSGARKMGVPFGPFLALGGLIGLLVGPELVDLYRDNFL